MFKHNENFSFLIVIIIMISINSCTSKKQNLVFATKKIANEMNQGFAPVKKLVQRERNLAIEIFSNIKNYDTSTDKMNIENGGKYKLFENTIYYKPIDDGGCALFVSGLTPLNNEIKQKVRLLENMCSLMKSVVNESPVITDTWINIEELNIGYTYPYFDMLSILPLKLDISKLDYHIKCIKEEANPKRKIMWEMYAEAEPMISMVGEGWTMALAAPIYIKNKLFASVQVGLTVSSFINHYIGNSEHMIMIVSKKSYLIGATQLCKNNIKLKMLRHDYLEQLKQYPKLTEEYKMSHEKQHPDLRRLAKKIKEETEFNIKIQGKNYFVVVENVPEVNFYVVGLHEI